MFWYITENWNSKKEVEYLMVPFCSILFFSFFYAFFYIFLFYLAKSSLYLKKKLGDRLET